MPAWLIRLHQFLAGFFAPAPAVDPAPIPPDSPDPVPPPVPAPGLPVVAAINAARASRGLPALVEDDPLARLAQAWAASMASASELDHGDFADRIGSVYPNTAAAENVAEGQPDAIRVVDAWMGDPPHRANILGDYNRLGVGTSLDESGSPYWCADFAWVD